MSQEISTVSLRVSLVTEGGETEAESVEQKMAVALLHLGSLGTMLAIGFPLVDLRGDSDFLLDLELGRLPLLEQRRDAARLQPPFGDEAVCRQATVQWRTGAAVLVDVVATGDRAE